MTPSSVTWLQLCPRPTLPALLSLGREMGSSLSPEPGAGDGLGLTSFGAPGHAYLIEVYRYRWQDLKCEIVVGQATNNACFTKY